MRARAFLVMAAVFALLMTPLAGGAAGGPARKVATAQAGARGGGDRRRARGAPGPPARLEVV
ncbi:hypothetical protein ACFWIJ_29920, partial [Streptomyces sp. NPDC127079]